MPSAQAQDDGTPALPFAPPMVPSALTTGSERRLSAGLVHAATRKPGPREYAPLLGSVLAGPVFYQGDQLGPEGGYTVLLPVSAAGAWRVRGTVVLPSHALVLIPVPGRYTPVTDGPWWVVPPAGPDKLCSPARLALLLDRVSVPTSEEALDA